MNNAKLLDTRYYRHDGYDIYSEYGKLVIDTSEEISYLGIRSCSI